MIGVSRIVSRLRRTVDPARRRRREIAGRYLRGNGIEIGALHNPLDVPRSAHVRYVDHLAVDELRGTTRSWRAHRSSTSTSWTTASAWPRSEAGPRTS